MFINRNYVELLVLSAELELPFLFTTHSDGWARVRLGSCYVDFRSNRKIASYISNAALKTRHTTHTGVALAELLKQVSWTYE